MYLYVGKRLRVDFSTGTATDEPLNRDWLRQFRGGWGLAAKYSTELAESLAPLSGQCCMVPRSQQNRHHLDHCESG